MEQRFLEQEHNVETQLTVQPAEGLDTEANGVTEDRGTELRDAEEATLASEQAKAEKRARQIANATAVMRIEARARTLWAVAFTLINLAVVLLMVVYSRHLGRHALFHLLQNPRVFIPLSLVWFGIPIHGMSQYRRTEKATKKVADLKDIRAVGLLVEVLSSTNPKIMKRARNALTDLLPQLRSSDAHLLSRKQKKILCSDLLSLEVERAELSISPPRKAKHLNYELAVLKALEQVGGKEQLPAVTQLAKASTNPQVRAAAVECLPYLRARIDEERISKTLLRPSGINAGVETVSPDLLLRPAGIGADEDPSLLLKASQADG